MVNRFVVAIPDGGLVRLISNGTGIAIAHVDECVRSVRYSRYFHPVVDGPGSGVISLDFMG